MASTAPPDAAATTQRLQDQERIPQQHPGAPSASVPAVTIDAESSSGSRSASSAAKPSNEDDSADHFSSSQPTSYPQCPEGNAGFFSRLLMLWVTPLVLHGWRTPLEDRDVWELQGEENAKTVVPTFREYYTRAKPNKKGRKLARALFVSQRRLFFGTAFLQAISIALGSIEPVFINKLLSWLQNPAAPSYEGYLWALALLLAPLFKALADNHLNLGMFRGGQRLRASIQGMLYEKALRMSPSSRTAFSVGQIVNYMQLDAEKIAMFCQMLHTAWGAPAQFIVAVALLYNYIGPSSLIGLAFTALTVPLQGKLLKVLTGITRKNATVTDRRVKLTNEVLQGIKAVKFYAWERPFGAEVDKIREQELTNIRKTIALRATFLMILFAIPPLVAVVTFAFYVGVFGNPLNPAKIFTALALLNALRLPLMMFPFVINSYIDSKVSVKRIERFLNVEETEDYARGGDASAGDSSSANGNSSSKLQAIDLGDASANTSVNTNNPKKRRGYVEIKDGVFTWGARGTAQLTEDIARPPPLSSRLLKLTTTKPTESWTSWRSKRGNKSSDALVDTNKEVSPVLDGVSLRCMPGQLTTIIGKVGSGKSSLAQAMLGEIKKLSGEVRVQGSVAYVPQSAWIFNGTLQDNVLFGLTLDNERYAQAIYVSALEQDLEVLPAGDLTAIGEKGINLSGGQKQRVSIARAVYSDADVYVFDDPLSALDAHVGKSVFENVLSRRGVLHRSTRVLVTNQLQFVPECDHVVWLENGRVKMQGTFRELMATSEEFRALMAESATHKDDDDAEAAADAAARKVSVTSSAAAELAAAPHREHTARLKKKLTSNLGRHDTLMTQEDRNTGNIGMRVYLKYAKATGGYLAFASILSVFGLTTAISVLNNWWLSYWSQQSYTNPDRFSLAFYLGIYFAFALSFAVFTFLRTVMFLFMALRASRAFHQRVFESVMHAPMQFFDTTPIGRIISRFARDVGESDTNLPQAWQQFLNSTINLLSSYILSAVVTPLFLAVAFPIAGVYYLLQRFYNRTNLEVKRLDSISKSPIYAHFSETLGGLSSIRAYNKQEQFRQTNLDRVNTNNRAYFCQIATNRWFSLWLELLGSILIFAAAVFGVIAKGKLYSGLVGLSLTYALQVTSFLSFCIRSITELEAKMNAIERLDYYATQLPQEAAYVVDDHQPPADWPQRGEVVFDNLQLRYRKELDLVLKGVSLRVAGGTKVGVIGRTGAGKSSLMVALLRLVEPAAGSISVDDIDLASIGLEDVRSRVTIIPQDPVMFSGSIRFNVDPFGLADDAALWDALDKAHLREFVSSLEGGLDGLVSEYGENLSAGQRQLICLARALVRKPRVLIMDEATSSVDHETDQMIQRTVRSEFADATVLTIAHRLWTIADYDMVLVMDNGVAAAYGTPAALLADPNSALARMVDALGPHQAAAFRALVEQREAGLAGAGVSGSSASGVNVAEQ